MLPKDNAYVEFENVCKSYDGRTLIVQNVNFSVRKGEFLTLLGPSGSGENDLPDDARRLRNTHIGRHPH